MAWNYSHHDNYLEIDNCTASVINCTQRTSTLTFGIARILFSIPGIILNTLFIATMIRNKVLRKSLILLTLLSFADLLISMYVLMFGMSDIITDKDPFCINKVSCFYLRPHLSVQICALQLQCIASLLVALERTAAILWPIHYYRMQKTKKLISACAVSIIFVAFSYMVSIIIANRDSINIYSDMCFPSRVVSKAYGGFIYLFSAILGCLAVLCYLGIFGIKMYKKLFNKKVDEINVVQRKREVWLIKVCFTLTLSDFIFIVIPHCVLYLGIPISCPDSFLWFMRRYVSFLFSTNSFVGMASSMIVSRELRSAVLDTLLCSKRKRFDSEEDKLKRLSSTRITEIDNVAMKRVVQKSLPVLKS